MALAALAPARKVPRPAAGTRSAARKTTAPRAKAPVSKPATKSKARPSSKALPKFRITIDDRTVDMTMEALLCRESGHHWNRVPQGPQRRALMADRGQTETVRVCSTCSSQRIELYWLPSFEPAAANHYVWSAGYLIAKEFAGTGRLSRAEVRKALFARDNVDLVA